MGLLLIKCRVDVGQGEFLKSAGVNEPSECNTSALTTHLVNFNLHFAALNHGDICGKILGTASNGSV
jgi:hypothetical protein